MYLQTRQEKYRNRVAGQGAPEKFAVLSRPGEDRVGRRGGDERASPGNWGTGCSRLCVPRHESHACTRWPLACAVRGARVQCSVELVPGCAGRSGGEWFAALDSATSNASLSAAAGLRLAVFPEGAALPITAVALLRHETRGVFVGAGDFLAEPGVFVSSVAHVRLPIGSSPMRTILSRPFANHRPSPPPDAGRWAATIGLGPRSHL